MVVSSAHFFLCLYLHVFLSYAIQKMFSSHKKIRISVYKYTFLGPFLRFVERLFFMIIGACALIAVWGVLTHLCLKRAAFLYFCGLRFAMMLFVALISQGEKIFFIERTASWFLGTLLGCCVFGVYLYGADCMGRDLVLCIVMMFVPYMDSVFTYNIFAEEKQRFFQKPFFLYLYQSGMAFALGNILNQPWGYVVSVIYILIGATLHQIIPAVFSWTKTTIYILAAMVVVGSLGIAMSIFRMGVLYLT